MRNKEWRLVPYHHKEVDVLFAELQQKIPKEFCNIYLHRGIHNLTDAKRFFNPSEDDLHDPFLMKDMQKALDRVLLAFHRKEKILVFGDYDVDGTTAVAIMIKFLRKVYQPQLVDFYIPHRYKEGYGISKQGIEFAAANDFSLIISVDCGIKSHQLVSLADNYGIDFIICDHHTPDATVPDAVAVLNPKQTDCYYPFKDLCGCGVAFKLISAYNKKNELSFEHLEEYLDLVTTAIAADIVSIVGENRVLASLGLQKVNKQPNFGIQALLQQRTDDKKVDIEKLVFTVAPRVNAAGRMDDARKAVELFIAPDVAAALLIANELHVDNEERKDTDQLITVEALEQLKQNEEFPQQKSTVVYAEHWHKGVVGIVASRLVDYYYKPTIVLTQSGNIIAGSARSVHGFNIHDAIEACREHLLGYGGHFFAAGLTMRPEQLTPFVEKFEQVVQGTIDADSLTPILWIDDFLTFEQIDTKFLTLLDRLEPFGPDNMRPIWRFQQVKIIQCRLVKEEHIRLELQQGKYRLTGIGFKLKHLYQSILENKEIDIAAAVTINCWNGKEYPQLLIYDIRPSQ
ncbi:single-stranded-DNA-specific exonuclease RecJ [Gynurincola endophyticus]|uniref:single-stranded-DNA-specific exonuclease RecJ n=1 Tax=Gynurincola endophyticus TaxID=2479004 RepID=UPI000F8CD6C0|nr:single-stranded-DNA-specific exonuclease RecJ [Gynurincola endophyticus]